MRSTLTRLIFCAAVVFLSAPASAQQPVIVRIQVHGNTLTPDDEIVKASGLAEGAPFSEAVQREAERRLTAIGLFQHVDVMKRYASITDPDQIIIVIQVDEGPVHVVAGALPGQPARVARRGRLNMMFVPLLDAEDGYGLAYGAQISLTGNSSRTSRVVFPLSWGGNKRAGAEFQKEFSARFAPRIRIGGVVQRRTHPFFKRDWNRKSLWGRGEWTLVGPLRAGTTVARQKATLLERTDLTNSIGADLTFDTRLNPLLPYNAVYATASIDRLKFADRQVVHTALEANGYVGIYRGSVVALRASRETMSGAVPPFFKAILGGTGTLRGFRAGTAIGDTMVTGSAELRVPLTSPLHVAKFGTMVFIDAGTAYDHGAHFSDQHFRKGVGAGVWLVAALFQLNLSVAHGLGAGTRVHFGAGLTF